MRHVSQFARLVTSMEEHTICVTATGDAPDTIVQLLKSIRDTAAPGHSFPIVVDPGEANHEDSVNESFFIDGDGADHITKIELDGKDVTS